MSTTMTSDERQAFLAGVHVGVVSLNQEGEGTSATIQYSGSPD